MKIAIVGAHASGKTTLGLGLTSKLKSLGRNAAFLTEVARKSPYLIAHEQSPAGQLHLFVSHIENELRLMRTCEILVTDRSALDYLVYMELFCPESSEQIEASKQFASWYVCTYDYIFRTTIMYDPDDTPDDIRPRGRELQKKTSLLFEQYLGELYPKFIPLPSTFEVDPVSFMIRNANLIK